MVQREYLKHGVTLSLRKGDPITMSVMLRQAQHDREAGDR